MEDENEPRRSKRSVKIRTHPLDEFPQALIPLRLWSKVEKTKLLQALERYDESDVDSISAFISTKSAQQVEHIIKSMRRKADRISKRNRQVGELDKWTRLLDKVNTDEQAKFDHLSIPLLLISLFEDFPNPSACEGIDFKGAYEFIFCIMAGIQPKAPNKKTLEFISDSFREMGMMISQNSELKNFVIEKIEDSLPDEELVRDILNPLNFPELIVPLSMRDYDD